MTDNEQGLRFWIRYVVVPIVVASVGLLVFYLGKTRPVDPQLGRRVIARAAIDFSSNDGVARRGGDDCERNLLTSTSSDQGRLNSVTYKFDAVGGRYTLDFLFTSGERRPLTLSINDQAVTNLALDRTTSGWCPKNLEWEPVGEVALRTGSNTLSLARRGPFPHLSQFKLTPR
jgi:hypothetical protein